MGEPIKLRKGDEEVTVYGPNQAGVLAAAGWQRDDAPEPLRLPEMDEELDELEDLPEIEPKPEMAKQKRGKKK